MRRSIAGVLCAVLVSTAVAMATAVAQPSDIYVSLGESSAAGPYIPNQVAPLACLRSDQNYAHLVAAELRIALHDASCSGAQIANAYAPQPLAFGSTHPPQLDEVTAAVSIVSVDFGINDYVDDGWTATGLASAIGTLLDDIRERAPRAEIFVMGKIQRLREGGCFPAVPLPQDLADQYYHGMQAINEVLAAVAPAHDAVFVDVYPGSIGHDACASAETRWVEGVFPTAPAQPMHANATGHRYEAGALIEALRASRARNS